MLLAPRVACKIPYIGITLQQSFVDNDLLLLPRLSDRLLNGHSHPKECEILIPRVLREAALSVL